MRRSAMVTVCLAVFVDMLGFGIILPSLPLHAASLGGGGVWVGALLTAYAAAQFVAAPILGSLSDRYGRRRVLLLSLAGSCVSLALTGVADSLALLLLTRVVAGGFGGATAVGQAYMVDLSTPKQRTRALGLIGASIGAGFVFGPAIGAGLSSLGLSFGDICLVAAGIAGANLVLGLFNLPVTPADTADTADSSGHDPGGYVDPEARVAPATEAARSRFDVLRSGLRRRGLRPLLLAVFATTFAFVGMETTFALLARDSFGLGPAGLGLVFTCVGVVMVVVQGGLVGRLADRYGEPRVAVAGALLLGLGLLVVPFAPSVLAYLALGILATGQGLVSPTTAALIARRSGRNVGGVLGAGQSAAAAARAVGPLVAGLAFDLRPSVAYLIGVAACVVAAMLLRTVRVTARGHRPAGTGVPRSRRPKTGHAELVGR